MKNHTRITRLLTALLTLCVLFACMAGTALADEFKGYVGSIGIVAADSADEAKAKLTSSGHTVLDMDLNEGTNSGKRIYMGYKTTMDPDQAIYGFGIFESNSNSATNWGGTFHAVGSSGEPNSAGGGKVNLNEGAGGKSLYLAVTRDKGFNDVPVTGIQLSHDINPSEAYPGDACSYTLDTSYGTSDRPHLNQDASGGSVIYLYYQRFIDMDTGVALTAYYLSESGAIQTGKVSKWLTNAVETVSFSSQPLTVTYNGMSYAFAGWHDANNATGAPENTSTTASAGMSSLGSTNFQSRYAAYKHDLKLSFNANGGTGAPAAMTQTQYLNLSHTKVRPQSVSFTIPSAAPTHSDATRTFYRWCTSADGTGTSYDPGDTITVTEDTTLYALWSVSAANCTVTVDPAPIIMGGPGAGQEPAVTVKHGNKTLTKGTDYTVSYSNNNKPGTAKVTVTLKGQYYGTLTAYFHIAYFDADAVPSWIAPPQEGQTATVTLKGYLDGVDVTDDVGWELNTAGVTLSGNTLKIPSGFTGSQVYVRGTYRGSGAYVQSEEIVDVYRQDVRSFRLNPSVATFDGMEHKPLIVDYVDQNGTPMVEDEDYTVEYLRDGVETIDFISAGTITVKVTGINDYQGTQTKEFVIWGADMSTTQFVGFQDTFLYNGQPQKPEITLELPNGYRLEEGRDYTLSYQRDGTETEDFTSVGTIRVTATAVENGNFVSYRNKSYTIQSNDISSSINITTPGNITYDGQPHGATVQVIFRGETLTEGEDYTVTYKRDDVVTTDLASAGNITVEVAGTGGYAGSKSASYTIAQQTITNAMVTLTPESAVWNGSEQKPEVTVSGISESDYTVTYKRGDEVTDDFTTCGTISVTVAPANGNCVGTASKQYVINHHPDMDCGHIGLFSLKYQATGSDKVEYSNDLELVCGSTGTSPLEETGGVVTLLKPITLDANLNVWVPDLTIDLNGNSITFEGSYIKISNYEGTLTIKGPGSVITQNYSQLYNDEPLVLIGDVTLDYKMSGHEYEDNIWSSGDVDLTGYTGGDLLIRSNWAVITVQVNSATHELLAYTPKKANNINDYTQPGTTGAAITDGRLAANAWAKVVRKHDHSWSFSLNESGDAIVAVCSGSGDCPVANNTATIRLIAPTDLTYDGKAKEVTVTQTPAGVFTDVPAVSYEGNRTDAGTHTASLTYGDVTAEKTFTIAPKDITGATVGAFDQMIYDGQSQTPKATVTIDGMTVTGTWSDVTNVSDKTTFTASGNFTGTIADQATGMMKREPTAADFTMTPPDNLFYTSASKTAAVTVSSGVAGMGAITVKYSPVNPVSEGSYDVLIDVSEGDNYTAVADLNVGSFVIGQSGTAMTATADKTSYIYGETITVTGTVKATGTAPATTLTLRSAPAAQQVALFAADGTQLTDPMNVVDGAYTLTYNTADKNILPAASITLTVKFVGDEDMADAAANVSIALTEKQLTAIEATAATRAYEPNNTTVSVTAVTISGVIGTDDVKVDATNLTGEITSSDAGTYTSVKLADLTLIGSNKAFYTISDATVTTSVEITPKEITNPTIVLDASSFVYDGTEKKPAVTSVKDGDDLIDATEYTVSYANNIEMGTATVTLTDVAGGNYTVSGSTTFQITQSGTAMTAKADKTSYTYGETITVTGTVKATGTAPATTLTLRSAPSAQQVALFAADGTQLTDPVNVVDGAYTLTYNTADKGILPAESITLTVKFVGDDNMADQSAAVTVALTAKRVEPVLSGSASKAYDGTTTVTDAGNLTINLTGIVAGDSVSASAAGYVYADETVGQSKTVTANGITLSGADSTFYTLAQTEASAQIGEIKKAMLIGLTEPADTTLDVYCADADAVIGKLPDTVVYHLADGKTVDLKVEWSCTAYDSTPGATNTFAWAVSDSEKLACYEIAQNVADDGTIIVTNNEFLPVTVTGTDTAITYNGTAYDVTQMFAIDSNAGAAVFEIIGGGTGEGTLNGSVLTITKAGTINIKVTTAPKAAYAAGEATAVLTISKGTPAVTLPTDLTAWYGQKLSDIVLPTIDGGAWSWTDTNSTVGDAGVQTHQAIFTPADTNLWNITTHPVNITVVQAGTSFGEMKVYNGDTESTTFTYGETVTVKAEATAVQPAAFSLRSLIAPAKHQMALFIRNADGSEVQISEAVNEQNGVYTMTYNTTGKALSIGDNALIAKFVGDENMADYQETVLVTLNPKELTIVSLTAQDRVYEPGNQQVAITGTEVSGKADANDDVSVLTEGMTATISSENVGTYDTAHIPQDVSLTGNHAGYYFARGNVAVSIPQGVEITRATPYTTSGAPAQPVFDPIYQDGQTLGDIPVSLADGTFNVPGTIEWEAPCDTPVTEGTPFTWVFTPDDPNWKPVSGTVVIYPDGEPPVITAPAGDQEVTVYEGEQGTLFITAADASSYQWYINRYDGLGCVPISGATSASYTTSVVNLGNDGFTYYCVASNAYGDTESPVFLLQVLEKIEVPETGDESNIALWITLAILSFAGLTIITMNGSRSKITR